ncbi:hypothetical protein [Campylobacter cuniculorum]|uniref:Uncharacterized protein n=1 Tax=Campylobacter cuniculorum TaxID=374106 RepID=A0ABX6TW13_9BACT|nr:hypothetical protein [Campylobacter cuniculorum]QOR03916.1 hypothetical protein A0071_06990 [Campylobacter cuniculorum]
MSVLVSINNKDRIALIYGIRIKNLLRALMTKSFAYLNVKHSFFITTDIVLHF